jgi:hypothetical protein
MARSAGVESTTFGFAYMEGAAGAPAVRRPGKGREHMSTDGPVRRPG